MHVFRYISMRGSQVLALVIFCCCFCGCSKTNKDLLPFLLDEFGIPPTSWALESWDVEHTGLNDAIIEGSIRVWNWDHFKELIDQSKVLTSGRNTITTDSILFSHLSGNDLYSYFPYDKPNSLWFTFIAAGDRIYFRYYKF